MAILNITYQGQSADYELGVDFATTDADIRRIAVEVVRSGGVRGLHVPNLPTNAFASFVVDRLRARRRAADLPAPEGPVRRDARRASSSAASARSARRRCSTCRNLDAELRLVDFDRVESKNLAAQWFVKQSVGKNKAEAVTPPARELLRRQGRGARRAARARPTRRSCSPAATSRSTASTTPTAASRSSEAARGRRASRSCTPRSRPTARSASCAGTSGSRPIARTSPGRRPARAASTCR